MQFDEVSMETPWRIHRISMEFHGVSMEHPLNSVEFLGCSNGYALRIHKELNASSTESPWSCMEFA